MNQSLFDRVNRLVLVTGCVLVLEAGVRSGAAAGAQMVTICHFPPGDPADVQVITVGANAVTAHIARHNDAVCSGGDSNCCFGGSTAPSVCTNFATDVNNCGECGDVCTLPNATPECTGGVCMIASCNPGFGDCNNNPADGCETSLANDPNNCGGCGEVCTLPNATPECTGGVCMIASCNPGFGDCNNNPADGCETSLANDPNNCGGCGVVCATGQMCTSGSCVSSCPPGQTLCGGVCCPEGATCTNGMCPIPPSECLSCFCPCASLPSCGTSPSTGSACFCFPTTEHPNQGDMTACSSDFECGTRSTCQSSADCQALYGPGFVCTTNTCCGANECAPLCSTITSLTVQPLVSGAHTASGH